MDEKYLELKPYYQQQFNRMDEDEGYKGKFNIFAFLFSFIWLCTKGCVKQGIMVLVVCGALNVATTALGDSALSFVTSIAAFAVYIFIGLRGNYLYYQSYKAKTSL